MSTDSVQGTAAPRRFAILTSGGDAPGMNAAIRAATLVLLSRGCEVRGVLGGYRGLIDGQIEALGASDVRSIIREGGTILGSARCLAFMEKQGRDAARASLAQAGVEALIVIGGNGSLAGAAALSDPAELGSQRLAVMGLPASIDNDIGLTGLSIGVDTAMNTIVDCVDKISDTALAHDRTFIIEVMGRDCGYLAMTSAVASAADVVLFPEAGKSEDDMVEALVKTILKARQRKGKARRVIAIKAEGAQLTVDQLKTRVDARLRALSGPGAHLTETRVTVLGHIVRGGRPSAFDRIVASRLAFAAVEGLMTGQTRKMAAWMAPPNLPDGVAARSPSDPNCWLIDIAAVLAETQRLLSGESPVTKWRANVFDRIEDALSY